VSSRGGVATLRTAVHLLLTYLLTYLLWLHIHAIPERTASLIASRKRRVNGLHRWIDGLRDTAEILGRCIQLHTADNLEIVTVSCNSAWDNGIVVS